VYVSVHFDVDFLFDSDKSVRGLTDFGYAIAYAVDGSNRMHGLIKDLLVYSPAGANGKALNKISSENALKEALTNLRASVEESNAVVTHDLLPAITMDETQLIQLFQNLVGNGIKYRTAASMNAHDRKPVG
jgi:light-regulated signal transduction histidine kinase (bacteriophytochrome)